MSQASTSNSRKSLSWLSLGVLAALFLGFVLVSQVIFKGWRLDLTKTQQYTLTEGTKKVLTDIKEPINLYFFFTSEAAKDIPQYQAYAARVRELLEEMSQRANGKLRLTVIDPKPFSEEEDRAASYGLQQVPVGNGESLFFGLAGSNSTNEQKSLAFFQLEKEAFLEYDIAKMLQGLNKPEKPVVGVISSLDMAGGMDPMTQQTRDPWVVYTQIQERFELRTLPADLKSIDASISMLMLVHPKELSEDAQFAIDQFVLRGGRLMLFLDPNAARDMAGTDPNNPSAAMFANKSSDLPKLLKNWGLQYDPSKLVADRTLGLQVQSPDPSAPPSKHPAIIGLRAEHMNQSDTISANLEQVNLDGSGALALLDAKAGFKLEPLLQSTTDAMLMDVETVKFQRDPRQLLADFKPSGTRYVMAGVLSGKFKTAFPEKSAEAGFIGEAKQDGSMLIVADTDLLSDHMWVRLQAFFDQKIANAFADNGALVVNAVDKFSGDSALIGIRTRTALQSGFSRVDAMRNKAQDQFQATEQQLQKELEETEREISKLQEQKTAQGGDQMILSPEQQAEIVKFSNRKLEIRKQLREVRRGLDQDIERLGYWVKFVGTFLMPILVALFAVSYFRRRGARRRAAALGQVSIGG
jgi:ABC-type uncharacterized transport system involved in gliding motility auxiliary subunit